MSYLLIAVLSLLASQSGNPADDVDQAAAKLTQAREAYATTMMTIRADVLKQLDDRENQERKRSNPDLNKIKSYADDREALQKRDEWPRWIDDRTQQRIVSARAPLSSALKAMKAAHVRAKEDAKAATLEKELAVLQSEIFQPWFARPQADQYLRITNDKVFFLKGAVQEQLPKPLFIEESRGLIYAKSAFGKANVLCTHPPKRDAPATIEFRKLTSDRAGTLTLSIHGYPSPLGAGGRVVIKVNGKVRQDVMIAKDDRWATLTIPFNREAVVVEHHPLGWNYEALFFDYEIK